MICTKPVAQQAFYVPSVMFQSCVYGGMFLLIIQFISQRLTVFESAIKRERLSSNFETTKELLGPSASSGSAARDSTSLGSASLLPWMPKTSAAVALRLFELDASIIYVKNEKPEPSTDKSVKVYMVS